MTEPRFLEQLQELDAKAAAVREQEARGTAACADVRGILDRLRVKVRDGDDTPKITRTSLPDTFNLGFPSSAHCSPSPRISPCLYWQSSSFRNTDEVFSNLYPPVFEM